MALTVADPRYQCICESGWQAAGGNPACTADVNECDQPDKPCSSNPLVPCYNTQGSFYCGACPAGWQGNGYSCRDVNECSTNNGGCATTPPVQCLNTMGSYHCGRCPTGYEGDGTTCTQTNICAANNGGCFPTAICSSVPGSGFPLCSCPPGYVGNGYGPSGCTQTSNVCQTSNPCVNGQCVATASSPGYICTCDPGWAGTTCNQNIDECASGPCLNGGTCTDGVNRFTCTCTAQWTGALCQTQQQECGGDLMGPAGSFSYPSTPGHEDYGHLLSCVWVIRTDANKILRVSFPFFHLETSINCNFDFLQVHDGDSASSHQLGRYCGTGAPPELFSSHNTLYFWDCYWTVSVAPGLLITFAFSALGLEPNPACHDYLEVGTADPGCGGTYTDSEGIVISPNWPNNYLANRQCVYLIRQPPGEVVALNFTHMSLESHGSCTFDYVERAGFRARYTVGCGGTFSGTGQIRTPYHPGPYPHNKQCEWVINQPQGYVVTLNFLFFDVEGMSCRYDFVEVRDGSTSSSPLLDTFCGDQVPAMLQSTQRSMYVRFKTDAVAPGNLIRLTFDSFNLEYHNNCNFDYVEVYDNGTVQTGTKLGSLSTEGFSARYISIDATTDCSETFTSPTGTLSSPNYPSNYPNRRECVYKIVVEVNMQIMLNFTDFYVEYSLNCQYDYVEIRDGGYETSPFIGRFCGNQRPQVLVSHSNRLWLKFRSDLANTRRGFTAHWDGTQTGEPYPLPYHPNAECYWHIKSSRGSDFHLEATGGCTYDYLAVYDGNSTSAPQLAKLCGSVLPETLNASSGAMYVKLRTDNHISAGGFLASYTTDCQGVQISGQHRGVIESLSFPDDYPLSSQCSWTVRATTGNTVNYTFTAFDLESTYTCSFDFVKLYDGPSAQSPLIGTFCGMTPPPANTTTGSALTLVFRSDSTVSRMGFQMMWHQYGCGGELSGPSGSFNSPGYPSWYPDNRECVWYITVAPGNSITINIHEFDVESHPDCSFDVLEVSSTGNAVTVRFKSDEFVSGRGFNASWAETAGGCGGPVTAPYGEIHSPSYPGNYPEHADCSWVIAVDPGHRVRLNFTDLDIEYHSGCQWDYVVVHDGPSALAPLLGRVCGSNRPAPIFSTQNVIYD
ncbi:hypothetical protein CRUP_025762 [Coryphaenoides rupestris]|nr:hypothetical protein CRUP_025762 [Coryphaenoides rupestris]